jgi:hypothetical protein
MKIEINNKEQNTEIKFPCLMLNQNKHIVILATEIDVNNNNLTGTCLLGSLVGHHASNWTASNYTPFNGSITLSNE